MHLQSEMQFFYWTDISQWCAVSAIKIILLFNVHCMHNVIIGYNCVLYIDTSIHMV